MLIAQITDIHIGFDPDNPAEYNRKRLDEVLDVLIEGPNRPDLLLATGDLTDRGDDDSYRRLVTAFSRCPFPVWPSVGNHDLRANFHTRFTGFDDGNGFVQYTIELPELRLVTIDTLEEGRHGGAFCDRRAAWLDAELAKDRAKPTYIVMHHPPVESGIEWMNTDPGEPWVASFTDVVRRHSQVRGLICGHLHRSVTVAWEGRTIAICSSTAPQVSLDLRPIDEDHPDDRPMIVAEDPAYALHRWNGRELVSFYDHAGAHTMLAKYDERLQPLVRELKAERPS
ncbi:3',5'-cyclic AMP phosphodiesterase CpdA [Sphingopyxis italica]|uniref:3',5'-cyclic AMP phosphodiesterase CpdA n=1 Tax=Sphingopyxis italica TaxID=1129133 RepID=A0A7X6B945_9SPHN|nr:metallophosphoesterase [Sphingopyxis italica]NJB90425.1 3',5'-cyclic AMP phosphodiesterase CpdA [Sphingopyxis italica]